MASASSAARAAASLRDQLSGLWWLQSIDFGSSDAGYVVKVRVSRVANDVSARVPAVVNGVPVQLLPGH